VQNLVIWVKNKEHETIHKEWIGEDLAIDRKDGPVHSFVAGNQVLGHIYCLKTHKSPLLIWEVEHALAKGYPERARKLLNNSNQT
jgi:hypothetical protein